MSVSIAEILRGAAAHAVPLTGECAGYLVLAAADQALNAPRQVDAAELHLLDDGSVRTLGTRACSELDAERDLRKLLDSLLSSASSVTPALLRAGRRAPGSGMAPLLREIERALIPVNRSAARRALARLEREAARAVESGRLTEPPASLPRRSEPAASEPVASEPVAAELAAAELAAAELAAAERAAAERAAAEPAFDLSPVGARLPEVALSAEKRAVSLEIPPPPPSRVSALPSLTPPPVGMNHPEAKLEVETRPEPIVLRATARPPAPPPAPLRSATPKPPVRSVPPAENASTAVTPSNARASTTPVLGTIACERSEDAPTWRPPAGELEIPVTFAADERTVFPDDAELMYADGDAHPDLTERCPPVIETIVPPPATVRAPADAPADRFTPVRRGSALFAVVPRQPEELVALDEEDIATPILTRVAPVVERPRVANAAVVATVEPALVEAATRPAESVEAELVEAEFVEPALVEAASVEAASVEAEFVEAESVEAESVEAELVEPALVEAASVEAEFVEAESVEAELVEPALVEAASVEAEFVEAESIEAELVEESVQAAPVTAAAPAFAAPPVAYRDTPHPLLALPRPRPSDVNELLGRLDSAPLPADELRSGLKRLAGLEPTPPPPGSDQGE